LGWWEKRYQEVLTAYRGASHGINRALALYDDFVSEAAAMRKRCENLEREREVDRARIGELAARVERMAEHLNRQRKQGSTEASL
jgi:HAMP domain-containing protein